MQQLVEIMQKEGFSLSQEQADKLRQYTELLLSYNQKFNLTAITDETEIIHKHFIDSLSAKEIITDNHKVIDIGSGAGFPSIPLKIFLPKTEFVLLDSLNKRVGFLNTVIEELRLTKIVAIHGRIEEAARKSNHREKYDFVVARAVAPMNTLVEYALPFLKIGGQLIAYKGDNVQEEIAKAKNALSKLRGKVTETREYRLMNCFTRSLVVVEKTAKTAEIYPRGQNKPKKLPL
jgi:16S rRNA (guanine527-N7)-methyltransferase